MATSTLADTLLDDLDDLSDVGEEDAEEKEASTSTTSAAEKESSVREQETQTQKNTQSNNNSNKGEEQQNKEGRVLETRFLDNASLQAHLERIQRKVAHATSDNKDDYQLIVESNRFKTRLHDELLTVHDSLVSVYGRKFPELQDLLRSPLEYKTAVQVIQNEMDLTGRVNDALNEQGGGILNSNQIITMSVASSTTAGRPLTSDELDLALRLCDYMTELEQAQQELTDFVQTRITDLAPALTALIGPQVAAQLVGLAGGLTELAAIPACNIQVLGQTKSGASARGTVQFLPQNNDNKNNPSGQQSPARTTPSTTGIHEGILVHCPLVAAIRHPQHRTRMLKQVASKVALCARCDAVAVQQGRPRSATPGETYHAQLVKKLQQWQEPDQAPVQKALPKPDLEVKKRRGGKRMRRWKERFEETALMKQANTRSFSTRAGEYGDDAMGLTMGLLDTEGGGRDGSARGASGGVTAKKAKISNTKAARKQRAVALQTAQQHNQQQQPEQSATSGLASTVAFTPSQAMELVNPDAQRERVRQANQKWFADTAGFQSALPKSK